ncbi:hypothetical protein AABM36_08340 [Kocuria sp. KSNUG]|uniref:hypothetical protein n=1 Tax=Kocuria sp. KSNUG TaxID=3136676 RepID=UPI003C30B404
MSTPSTAPLLADPQDLVDVLPAGTIAGGEDPRAVQAVRRASNRFRAAARHPVHRVTGDQMTFDGPGGHVLRLPVVRPTVHRVTDQGQDITAHIRVSPDGYLQTTGRPFSTGYGAIVVELDHGYEHVPPEIADAVLDAAARALAIPVGIKDLALDGASVSFGSDQGTSQDWADAVSRYGIGAGDRA